jgi:hypothetical protein
MVGNFDRCLFFTSNFGIYPAMGNSFSFSRRNGFYGSSHTVIPGAVRYALVYDNGATQAVITVPPSITESELDATLRQAASDLYSYGRNGIGGDRNLTIRARVFLHPKPGVSLPVYLGQVKRPLSNRDDEQMRIEIFPESFAKLETQATQG